MTLRKEAVQRVVATMKRHADYEYVFETITSADWIRPLLDAGFFRHPPEPERAGDTVRFPAWPESRFLARIAGQRPAEVARILADLEPTANQRVHEDIVDAALAMPANISVRLAALEIAWIEKQQGIYFRLPRKYAELVKHLLVSNLADAALGLARALIDFRESDQSSDQFIGRKVDSRLNNWDYEQFIKGPVAQLIERTPSASLRVLEDLLEKYLLITRHTDDEPDQGESIGDGRFREDYSYIWQDSLDRNSSYHRDVRHYLVVATARAAIAASQSPDDTASIVKELERRRFAIFHRIALYVLARTPNSPLSVIRQHILDPFLFDNPSVLPEYAALEEKWFGELSEPDQRRLLEYIDRRADQAGMKERHRRFAGEDPTQDDLDRWTAQWQRDRLAPISSFLTGTWKQKYERYVSEFGPPEWDRTSTKMSVGTFGSRSPIAVEELTHRSVYDVAKFLNEWKPAEGSRSFDTPSKEGLGDVLASVVRESPQRFSEQLSLLSSIDEYYQARIIGALRECLRNTHAISWTGIMDFAIRQIAALNHTGPNQARSWALREIVGLVEDGLSRESPSLPLDLRDTVWRFLQKLIEVRPLNDASDESDPLSTALNSLRGRTLYAILAYALWAKRSSQSGMIAEDVSTAMVAEALEAFRHELIRRQLSLADHAFFGASFPLLVSLNRNWTEANRILIFPRRVLRKWNATWSSYVIYNRVYLDVVDVLRSEYGKAIARLHTQQHDESDNSAQHLAEHVAAMLLSGQTRASTKYIVRKFFQIAPAVLRGRSLSTVGRALPSISGKAPGRLAEHLVKFWRSRVRAARRSVSWDRFEEEFVAFGWWMSFERFEASWRLNQLNLVLDHFGRIDGAYSVLETLAQLAAAFPVDTVLAAKRILLNDPDRTEYFVSRDAIQILSTELIASGNHTALGILDDLANQLAARGIPGARDLRSISAG